MAKLAGLPKPAPPVPPKAPVGVPKAPAPRFPWATMGHQPAMPPPPAVAPPAEGVVAAPEAAAGHEGAPCPEMAAADASDDTDFEEDSDADTDFPWMRQLPNLQICPSCTKSGDQMPEIFWSQLHVASMHMHEAFLPHLQNEVTHQRPHGSMGSPLHALLVL